MKIDIIIVYEQRYKFGHEKDFVPPLTGIHLAALTPSVHKVKVYHQQVDKVDLNTNADLIAISFFSGFAMEAFRLADEFRKRNKTVIAGGPHVSFGIEESLAHFDAIVIGEAESVWKEILSDFELQSLKVKYDGNAITLNDVPTPRYDLLSDKFFIKRVIQATRGCPYSCSFCTVPRLNTGFRKRPIENVLRDIAYNDFKYWWQRKIVWFWDDNLTIDRTYIKSLLRQMIPLKKWWLTQASIDIVKDDELLWLMKKSGCIGVFLGLETFGERSILDANKKQNRISDYRQAIKKLHKHGISVMAGLIAGFDHDTYDSIIKKLDNLMSLGIDVPFLSIMTPYIGTDIYIKLDNEKRILKNRGWNFYNGYNVTFKPQNLSAEDLLKAHRELWSKIFSFKNSVKRIMRSISYLRPGAFLMTLFMNGFYGLKKLRNNYPKEMMENINDD
jgi:radical SAM superfamily enzyme YgiQ (UPF0313 family)